MTLLTAEELKSLKDRAMMEEKEKGLFSVRIGMVGGFVNSSEMTAVSEMASRFGDGTLHLTVRQCIEISHVPYANLEPLGKAITAAGLKTAAAGKCVRGITSCPGTYCKFGQFDTQSLARRLHQRVGTRGGLPHKFKIGIAGCRNGCTKPQENDLGIMGTPKGYKIFVGGKMGKNPRMADLLAAEIANEEDLLALVEAVLTWYAAHGNDRERFGATIDRIGHNRFAYDLDLQKNTENGQ